MIRLEGVILTWQMAEFLLNRDLLHSFLKTHDLHYFSLWVNCHDSYCDVSFPIWQLGPWISIIISPCECMIAHTLFNFILFWLVNTCTCTYIVFSWRKFYECLILFFSKSLLLNLFNLQNKQRCILQHL